MTLSIQKFELSNYRNYESFTLDGVSELTIFVGPNAVGKTNLVEAIDLVTGISSFRNAKTEELVGNATLPTRVKAVVSDEARLLDVELRIVDKKKKYLLNGKEKQAHALKGMIPAVTFIPDDLTLIKGSNTHRRHALDLLGSQLSVGYPVVRREYEQILRQKNNLLKDDPQMAFLESLDEVVARCATQLFCYRVSLFQRLLPYVQDFYQDISHRDELVTAEYVPSWALDGDVAAEVDPHDKESVFNCLQKAIEKRRFEEIARKHALVGPHKDEIRFFIDGRPAEVYGSQGQQRSLVLSWKLAEVALIEEMLSTRPILILDDVMSELDEVRRNELTKYVLRSTQTFITTTNIDYFSKEMLDLAQIVKLGYR